MVHCIELSMVNAFTYGKVLVVVLELDYGLAAIRVALQRSHHGVRVGGQVLVVVCGTLLSRLHKANYVQVLVSAERPALGDEVSLETTMVTIIMYNYNAFAYSNNYNIEYCHNNVLHKYKTKC